MFKNRNIYNLILISGLLLFLNKNHAGVGPSVVGLSQGNQRLLPLSSELIPTRGANRQPQTSDPTNSYFNEEVACELFSEVFRSAFDSLPDLSETGVLLPLTNRSLQYSQTSVIFYGTGPAGDGGSGFGNAKYYTVSPWESRDPDLLADMNVQEHFAGFPNNRFHEVIAANIPRRFFAANFFITARRILAPGGVLIVNTMLYSNSIEPDDVNKCLAAFGFLPVPEKLDEYEAQLRSIGYTEDDFPFKSLCIKKARPCLKRLPRFFNPAPERCTIYKLVK